MRKDNSTNCKFCKNNAQCNEYSSLCNWELADTPPDKKEKLKAIELELRNIDWTDSRGATLKVILLEEKLFELQVWYRLFP